eukprot:jgi/Chlat1/2738/Chrsp182S02899
MVSLSLPLSAASPLLGSSSVPARANRSTASSTSVCNASLRNGSCSRRVAGASSSPPPVVLALAAGGRRLNPSWRNPCRTNLGVAVAVAPSRAGLSAAMWGRYRGGSPLAVRQPFWAAVFPALRLSNEGSGRRSFTATMSASSRSGDSLVHTSVSSRSNFNGVFLLLVANIAVFVLDHILKLPGITALYLNHSAPQLYQFVTSIFCHASWSHLSGNLFFLYVFGKLVEEEEGSWGVWLSYLACGVGANIASWLALPSRVGVQLVSLGASGAVFGLFAVSVLVKLSWNLRKMLEVVILGQFVVEKVMSEARLANGMSFANGGVNHIAHLAGAMVGVALIYALSRLPAAVDSDKRKPKSRLPK